MVKQGPNPVSDRIGMIIGDLRRERGWSQEKLAEVAEISRNRISTLERGYQSVGIDNLAKILRALDFSLAAFFNQYFPDEKAQNEL